MCRAAADISGRDIWQRRRRSFACAIASPPDPTPGGFPRIQSGAILNPYRPAKEPDNLDLVRDLIKAGSPAASARWALKGRPDFARRANPICQTFSQSLAREHDPSDVSRLVDLGPMPRFKDMNRANLGLGSHVLGDGDMKIGVGLPPNE